MFIAHFTGNLGRDPETRSTSGGDVCSFSIAVKQGFGKDAPTEWFRCSAWGKQGEAFKRYMRKGMKVTVAGQMTIGEYEGKPQYNVRVIDADWPFEASSERRDEPRQGSGGGNYSPDDLSDEVPF